MPDDSLNRRQFARTVALGAVAATVPADASKKDRNAVEADKPRDREAAEAPKQPDDLALEIIKQRYPDRRLTGRVLDAIRADIHGDQLRSKALKTVPLTNGDEPAFVFAAYRANAIQ